MDYESRKIKWYWLLVFIVYCGGVVYLLFQGNPFLYAKAELRSSLDVGEGVQRQTFPQHPGVVAPSSPTAQARYSLARTAIDPVGSPRSKNYVEYQRFPLELGIGDLDVQSVSPDPSGFYLTGKSPWAIAIGLDGKVRWKYRFKGLPAERSLLPTLLNETSVFLIHPQGEVVCLDKSSGEIRWIANLREDVAALPLLRKKNLLVPTKIQSGGVRMNTLNVSNGQVDEESPHLEIKPGFQLSESSELGALIATVDNKVLALDPEDATILWSQILTDPIRGPAVVVGSQIYVATLGAKVVKLDGSKKGKMEWEADTVKPPSAPPAFLPIVNRLSILDTSGGLSAIDAKTGKVYWRLATENRNLFGETWSARLKGNYIEEFKMDWLHKGWTIWSPCGESHFCIYAPAKGQLINRIALTGRPLGLPLAGDHRWSFITQTKPGHFVLSQLLEESEIKKLHAEAAHSNP